MKRIILIPSYEPDDKLITLLKSIDKKFEIIVVNDGSNKTFDNIFEEAFDYAKIISYDTNQGKGYALKEGFKYIKKIYKKDYLVVTMDSDGQHKISDAIKLFDFVEEHPKYLALGMRKRGDKTPIRSKIGNTITMSIYKHTTGINIYDTQTGLRCFSYQNMDAMLEVDGNRYDYEMNVLLMTAEKNIKIKEIEIETIYFDNNSGSHFNTVKDSILVYKQILKFSLSSISSFIIDYLFYILFISIFKNITISNICARIISATFNYNINKRIVFKSKKKIYKSFLSYALLAICILTLNTILLNVFVNLLSLNVYLSKIIVELILFVISYIVQKKFIF